ncbi:MAG TPA: hypothetical protein VJR89_27285 [Polyangiales bacterium]|nr:hypothetical protein [Polyangiales bacterium]
MQTKVPFAAREDHHSLAPIQLDARSFERDLAALKRGQGKRLIFALLGSLLAMAALLLWMKSADGRYAYEAAAKQLDALYARRDPAFEHCTLLQPYASRDALRIALEASSQTYRKSYAKQLEPCSRALVILDRQLSGLDVPMSLEHRFEGLRHAANALNRAIGSYRSYLFDPNRSYDFGTASSHIDYVVIAWSHYDNQRTNAFDALHAAAQDR